jgi:hypothetical protein
MPKFICTIDDQWVNLAAVAKIGRAHNDKQGHERRTLRDIEGRDLGEVDGGKIEDTIVEVTPTPGEYELLTAYTDGSDWGFWIAPVIAVARTVGDTLLPVPIDDLWMLNLANDSAHKALRKLGTAQVWGIDGDGPWEDAAEWLRQVSGAAQRRAAE